MRNSQIILCKNIKLDKNYKNVLNYNETQMLTLCSSSDHVIARDSQYSFIRETGDIAVNFSYQQCLSANYIAYQNPDYSNKWFFAFINNVAYVSDSVTRISFTIDVWSTWFSYLTLQECFVVREHVNSDKLGEHTVPEKLAPGEYLSTDIKEVTELSDCVAVLGTTASPYDGSDVTSIVNGVPNGCAYYVYELNNSGIDELKENLQYLTDSGKESSVTSLFVAPKFLAKTDPSATSETNKVYNSFNPDSLIYQFNTPQKLDEYIPKNKKMLTYPYCYNLITNGSSGSMILQPELFNTIKNTQEFEIDMSLTPGCSIIGYPLNYDGKEQDIERAIPLAKYPQLNYSTDLFTNWQTENGLNNTYSYLNASMSWINSYGSGLAKIASLKGNTESSRGLDLFSNITSAMNSAEQIALTMQSEQLAERVPMQMHGNTNSGDVMFSTKNIQFKIYTMTIKKEFAKIIDDFMSRFGYTVNSLKTPNITGRKSWNYIEISDGERCFFGSIPTNHLDAINLICSGGVTIWHDHNSIGNYSLDNSII